jgi:hypothetical protein
MSQQNKKAEIVTAGQVGVSVTGSSSTAAGIPVVGVDLPVFSTRSSRWATYQRILKSSRTTIRHQNCHRCSGSQRERFRQTHET